MATINTTAETNLITQAQMKKVREVDFVNQFTHTSLEKLIEVLDNFDRGEKAIQEKFL